MYARALLALAFSFRDVSSFEFAGLSRQSRIYVNMPHADLAASGSTTEAGTSIGPQGNPVKIVVKRSFRNPVDTSQLATYGSTFYATGYEEGWVMMQTASGVADGRGVIAVISPGKHPPGSSVEVDGRHVVEKPEGLDWDRAAMLPFLVRCFGTSVVS